MSDQPSEPQPVPYFLDKLQVPRYNSIPDGREGLNPQENPKSWRCRRGYHDIRDRHGERPATYRISSGLGASHKQYWHCKRCERIFEAHEVWDGRRRKLPADQYADPSKRWSETWDSMDCVDHSMDSDKANPFMGDKFRKNQG